MIGTRKLALVATLAAGTAATFAGAAWADPEVNGRFENQYDRIEQGYENGSLTKGEACRLLAQERDLRREQHHAARNGMSDREKEAMNRDLNRESRRIHADRTNDRDSDRTGRNIRHLDC